MVCFKGDNILTLKYLSQVFQGHQEKTMTFFSESDNAIWLEYETWLNMINKKDLQDELSYYYISSFPFNLYDVYSNFRNVYHFTKGVVTRKFEYHIVITMANDEILFLDAMEKLAEQFLEKVAEVKDRYPAPFEVVIRFHAAYNVFGDNKYATLTRSNQIQQFINLFYEVNAVYLTVDPQIYVTGTDVVDLANTLYDRTKPSFQYTGKGFQLVPFYDPVSQAELIKGSERITCQFKEAVDDGGKQKMIKDSLLTHARLHNPAQLVKKIYQYIG